MRLGGGAKVKSAAALVALAVAGAGVIPVAALGGAMVPDSARTRPRPPSAFAPGIHEVTLEHKRFLPGAVSIRRGERVMWLWREGSVLHNVIGKGFQSRTVTRGSFTVRFTRRGRYSYTCTVHPHMDGSITVH